MQKAQGDGQEDKRQTTQCKKCKTSVDTTYVVDSRTYKGTVRRRRKCRICDTKVYTEEKIVAVGKTPWAVKSRRKIEKALPKKTRKRILKPHIKETVKEPDFDTMTDEQLEAWIFNQE